MSDKVFLDIVNMSITGSFAILIIILARLLLKKTPKVFSYALWFVAFFRLLVPVSLYYRVVVFIAPIQGLCYTVRDAVDWFRFPTARRFLKGSNHSPLQYC